MRSRKKTSCLVALLAVLAGGCSNEPDTYYECILETVTAGMEDSAVSVLSKACRSKFPRKDILDRPCTETEQSALTGRAKHYYGAFEGVLHNASRDTRFLAVEIGVTTTIDGQEVSLIYRDDLSPGIPPLAAVEFGFPIVTGDVDATYRWYIAGATCKQKR